MVKASDSSVAKLSKNILAGSCARVTSLVLLYSLDYTRTRLAADVKVGKGAERQFTGIIDVYQKTLQSDGIKGLYRGFAISFLGIMVYRGLYFGLFDTLKTLVTCEDGGIVLHN